MFETVEIPVWSLWLGGVLATIAIVDRIAGPWIRWYFRKWANQTIEEMNQRLDLDIKPLTLTKRQVVIDRLLYDAEVMEAVEAHARATGKPRHVSFAEAELYAREIVPAFSAVAYFKVGTRLSRWFCDLMYRVHTHTTHPEELAGIDREATVVFVMNHRSNMDYLLVTHLAAERSALAYAVGEWAQVWPLNRMIRWMGGYFIRRRARSPLYRKVLARYVRMATDGGVTQAVFPEGGLSLDGRLQAPKLGLLSYIVQGADEAGVVFIPVGINYDRVLEDRILTSATVDRRGRPRFKVPVVGSVVFVFTAVLRRLFGWYSRHGYALVAFGEPLTLPPGSPRTLDHLGGALLDRIGAAVPVPPVAVLAEALLAEAPRPREALISDAAGRYAAYGDWGAVCPLEHHDFPDAADRALTLLERRKLVIETAEGPAPGRGALTLLTYYANSIAHHRPSEAEDGLAALSAR